MKHLKFTQHQINLIRNGKTVEAAMSVLKANPQLQPNLIIEAIHHEQESWTNEQINSITLTFEEIKTIRAKKKFNAMKMVKERTKCTLKVAKGVVENYIIENKVPGYMPLN